MPPTFLPIRSFGSDAGCGVDEQEAVSKAPVEEYGDPGERMVLVAGDEIGADIVFADIELGLARQPPMPFARAHVR